MPIGKCKLCLRAHVELQKSHFIPAAAYKAAQKASGGEPPVIMKSSVTLISNEQAVDYVLCSKCEQRFSENGERWVMQNCYRPGQGFKIKELLDAAVPVEEERFKTYSAAKIPQIDIEQLAYFVCSVLWRGSVHEWRSGRHVIKSPKLGPYEEELRRYLLGETGFPEHAAFWLSVISDKNLWGSNLFPYGEKMDGRFFWRYKFIFQGLAFMFFVGRSIDPVILRTCTHRSPDHPLFVTEKMNEMIISDAGKLMMKSRVVGSMAKTKVKTVDARRSRTN